MKPPIVQLLKNFPAFYGNRRFITVFTRALHWSLFKESAQVRGFLWSFVTSLFLRWGVVSPTLNPQAGGPPLVGCPRLLIQYIRRYLEGDSSIRNLRTRHVVVTRDPPNMALYSYVSKHRPHRNCQLNCRLVELQRGMAAHFQVTLQFSLHVIRNDLCSPRNCGREPYVSCCLCNLTLASKWLLAPFRDASFNNSLSCNGSFFFTSKWGILKEAIVFFLFYQETNKHRLLG
jgi:hypothetical protein